MNKQAGCVSVLALRERASTLMQPPCNRNSYTHQLDRMWTNSDITNNWMSLSNEATLKKETEGISGCELNVTTVYGRECQKE